MIFFIALIPATMLTVAGYLALYISGRTEGGMGRFGRYLSFWAFTLAALIIVGSILATARLAADRGQHMGMQGMHGFHGRMHGGWPMGPRQFGPRWDGPRDAGPPDDGSRPAGTPPPAGADAAPAPKAAAPKSASPANSP